MAMLARRRVGTELCTLGTWSTHKDYLRGHSCHPVSTYKKLIMLRPGDYSALELYGNASKGRVGTELLVHTRHLVNT